MGRTILLKVVLPPCIAKQTPLKRSQGVDSSLFLRGCNPSHGTGDILGWLSCAAPQQTVSSFTAGLLWLAGSSVVHLAHYQFIMPTLWASLDTWMHHDVTFYCNQPSGRGRWMICWRGGEELKKVRVSQKRVHQFILCWVQDDLIELINDILQKATRIFNVSFSKPISYSTWSSESISALILKGHASVKIVRSLRGSLVLIPSKRHFQGSRSLFTWFQQFVTPAIIAMTLIIIKWTSFLRALSSVRSYKVSIWKGHSFFHSCIFLGYTLDLQ